jgi:hypothetical protein
MPSAFTTDLDFYSQLFCKQAMKACQSYAGHNLSIEIVMIKNFNEGVMRSALMRLHFSFSSCK